MTQEITYSDDGYIICQFCRKPAKKGWVWKFGPIILSTCARCKPAQKEYRHMVNFYHERKKKVINPQPEKDEV